MTTRRHLARYTTTIELAVAFHADPDDDGEMERAADETWKIAEEYLQTLGGDGARVVAVNATLDGIAHDEIAEG